MHPDYKYVEVFQQWACPADWYVRVGSSVWSWDHPAVRVGSWVSESGIMSQCEWDHSESEIMSQWEWDHECESGIVSQLGRGHQSLRVGSLVTAGWDFTSQEGAEHFSLLMCFLVLCSVFNSTGCQDLHIVRLGDSVLCASRRCQLQQKQVWHISLCKNQNDGCTPVEFCMFWPWSLMKKRVSLAFANM